MDTSKQYIEMCDCPEIQTGRTLGSGDCYYQRLDKAQSGGFQEGVGIEELHNDYGSLVESGPGRVVWLPRQDQLQEMVHKLREDKKQFSGNHGLLCRFAAWVDEDSNLPCASMEQLWLAFLMREKYDKVWDGKWVDRV